MPSIEPRKPGGRRKPFPGEEHLVTRAGSRDWHYDFTLDGHRLRGTCRTADLEKAAAFAAARFDEEFRRIRLGEQPVRHLTLNDAFGRYYLEVGKGTTYGEKAQKHQMARMLAILGRDTRLAELDDVRVNDLVQALRSQPLSDEGPRAGKVASGSTITGPREHLVTIERDYGWWRGAWNLIHGLPLTHGVKDA